MATIDILLASYNGAKYIETQILSIVCQSYKNWRLVIHDDGSSDDTITIIKRLAAVDQRIELIEDGIICGGAAANFMYLTRFAMSKYVMFCDQDDIWFDNKVEAMYSAICLRDQSKPQVAYSNSYVWKPDQGIKGLATLAYPKNVEQFLFLNGGIQGCAAIFNQPMCVILAEWNGKCAMHDHVLLLAALTLGEVTYMKIPLMLYRNHADNVTGETATTSMDIITIAKNSTLPVVDRMHYDSIQRFYNQYSPVLKKKDFLKIKLYLDMVDMRFGNRVLGIINGHFQTFNSQLRLLIKLILRPYIN